MKKRRNHGFSDVNGYLFVASTRFYRVDFIFMSIVVRILGISSARSKNM
jgi:hypothetical protein